MTTHAVHVRTWGDGEATVVGDERTCRTVDTMASHDGLAEPDRALLRDASAVLDRNWRDDHTVPSADLYPHQWSWDTAFIAIGRSWRDQDRAQVEMEHLLAAQWSDGMVPHIVFNPAVSADAYFPGPGFWRSDRAAASPSGSATSGLTQPPLHALAALEIWRSAGDEDAARGFLGRIYPTLVAQHRYLESDRDVAGDGLSAIVHPWESGMDNSPAWDEALDDLVIDPGAIPPYTRRDLVRAAAADRPSDETYDRFVYLAATYRDAGYGSGGLRRSCPFLVEDPLFNSVRIWSLDALAEIADVIGGDPQAHRDEATRVSAALRRRLWDPHSRQFRARDVRNGELSSIGTITSLMPVIDRRLPPALVSAVTTLLDRADFRPRNDPDHFMVASFDLQARGFDPRQYWRGPIWINTDWLLWRGLTVHRRRRVAGEIAGSMLGLARRSGWREYFSPFGGEGYGSRDFSWTAALVIDLLHRTRRVR
jgi:glycogen debranching enzyme